MPVGTKIDETGNRYGRLIVIREHEARTKAGAVLWECLCDCGNSAVVAGVQLRSERTKSCGCLQKDRSREYGNLPLGQSMFNSVYRSYKYYANKRNLCFDLTKEDFSFLTKMNCYYCGSLPLQTRSAKECNGGYLYNGIDRLDNNKGYAIGNVVPCCKYCNVAKNKMTIIEFRKLIQKIARHRGWG